MTWSPAQQRSACFVNLPLGYEQSFPQPSGALSFPHVVCKNNLSAKCLPQQNRWVEHHHA